MSKVPHRFVASSVGVLCAALVGGLLVVFSGSGPARQVTTASSEGLGVLAHKPAGMSNAMRAVMKQDQIGIDAARRACGGDAAGDGMDLRLVKSSVGVVACSQDSYYLMGPPVSPGPHPQSSEVSYGAGGSESPGEPSSMTFYGAAGDADRITFVLANGREIQGLVKYGYYVLGWIGPGHVRNVVIKTRLATRSLRLPASLTPQNNCAAGTQGECAGASGISVAQLELAASMRRKSTRAENWGASRPGSGSQQLGS